MIVAVSNKRRTVVVLYQSFSVSSVTMQMVLSCVSVGNIPYDATEEQLKEIFNQVGQVVSFRFV